MLKGIKKVICSICGKEVTKRQSYSVGNGKRACKEHEGVEAIKTPYKDGMAAKAADERVKEGLRNEM